MADNPQREVPRYEKIFSSQRGEPVFAPRDEADLSELIDRAIELHQGSQLAEAERLYLNILQAQPSHADAMHLLGVIRHQQGRHAEALDLIESALIRIPQSAAALSNLGAVLHQLKRYQEALAVYDRALAIRPDDAQAHFNRGIALKELERPDEAVASYDKAIALKPDYPDALHNRGVALMKLQRFDEALASYEQALAIEPHHRHAFSASVDAALHICDWTRAARLADELVAHIVERQRTVEPFSLLGICDDPALHLQGARNFIRDKVGIATKPLSGETLWRHDRIRIAYLSGDFHEHATAFLTAELFERHDRSRFEVVGVSFGRDDASGMRARLVRAFDQFHDVRTKNDLEAAKLLRAIEIDIAVDLKGYTGDCRPAILAHRPAPIQVSYLGYPGTLGAEFIDYVIADAIVLPSDQQPFYTEKIVQLPECYQVNDSKRRIGERTPTRREAGLPAEGFVFCCFNNNYKITAPVFDIWMRLLGTVENSVLWLVRDNAGAESNLRKEAAARGIDRTRLVFADKKPLEEHLARYRQADLFLDTLPYNAHTTASDALWAGVPVLTCRGVAFAGRVAASLLSAIGLPELVTDSLGAYEALAFQLATDASLLGGLRARLARNRLTHPLFDTDRFRRHIESAYATMWEQWQRGDSPRSFRVEPHQGANEEDARPAATCTRYEESSQSNQPDSPPAGQDQVHVSTFLSQAISLQQSGQLEQAERLYSAILQAQPDHFDATHLLGVVRHQQGRDIEALELVASALQKNPCSAKALSNYGVVLKRLGRFDEALASFDRALVVTLGDADALYNRGIVLKELGRLEEAVASYDRALEIRPDHAETLNNRGIVLHDLGRLDQALISYDRALAIRADYAEALNNRATALRDLGRLEEAVESYDRALVLEPACADARSNRGIALKGLGLLEEAVASYDLALILRPDDVAVLNRRGNVLLELRRLDEALATYSRVLAIRPEDTAALNHRGVTLSELKRPEEALGSYEQAIALDPCYAGAFNNRAAVLFELGRLEDALASCDRALALKPEYAEALNNRGTMLRGLKRLEEALESYDRALSVKPDYADALHNRGIVSKELGRFDEALASYDAAIALKPQYPDAVFDRSLCQLLLGDFGRGWRGYEQRWRTSKPVERRHEAHRLWLGAEELAGQTILLHAEQGFGDTIQFVRYAGLVKPRGARVLLEVQPPLKALMQTLPWKVEVFGQGDRLPDFDLQCPILSLPLAFDTIEDTIPWPGAYLEIEEGRFCRWQEQLREKTQPRVGIVWSGSAAAQNAYLDRSIALDLIAGLFGLPVEWVCLQKEIRGADRTALPNFDRLRKFADEIRDFADTAALISCCDLVISVDTAVAHLAGAMGKPVWILLPNVPDWRWLLDRDDSPWYPTARLFRQQHLGDWPGVINRVYEELRVWMANLRPEETSLEAISASPGTEAVASGAEERTAPEERNERYLHRLVDQAVALHQKGRVAEAERLYMRILEDQPDHFDATHLLGVVRHQQGRDIEALELVASALQKNPCSAKALSNYGVVLKRLGRFDEALASFDRALVVTLGDADALYNRGIVLKELGRLEEAVASYDRALEIRPDHAETLNNRGIVLHDLGRLDQALISYDRALAIRADYAEALNNRATALRDLGRLEEAVESYDRALVLEPACADALSNRGIALKGLGLLEEAVASYDLALILRPDDVAVLNRRGNVLLELRRLDEALATYSRVLAIRPEDTAALNHRGATLFELKRPEEALGSYEEAIALDPCYADAFNNRAAVLFELGRFDEALASFDRAIELDPDDGEYHFNRSLLLLLQASSSDSWREYESRRKTRTWVERGFKGPEWRGEDISGKRVLLYGEQGLGDTIQFSRFARSVADLGAEVILDVQPPLRTLLQYLDCEAIVVRDSEKLPDFDIHLPLMSVPFILELAPERNPGKVPYLAIDPGRSELWSSRLPADAFKVGVAWQGNPAPVIDKGRSVPLKAFAPLSQVPGVRLISLQKGAGAEQLADLPPGMTVETLGPDFDEGPGAFLDTAAVMMNLDLIVTCDTAVAHLAGALGRPVWIILKHVPDWRWMLDREDSPWYPTARLFRQRQAGDWDEVFTRVRAELANFSGVDRGPPVGRQRSPLYRRSRDVSSTPASRHPTDLRQLLNRAVALHKKGRLAKAERLYSRILEAEPAHFHASHLLGVIRDQQGRHAEALDLIDAALTKNPQSADALSNRGLVLHRLGRHAEASASFDQALAIRPDHAEALNNRGNLLKEMKRPAEALASYDRALAVRPNYVEALDNRGSVLKELNRREEALASYEGALALRPDYVQALNNRGNLLMELERVEEALASYDRALAIRPDYAEALNNRGNALQTLERFEEALAAYDQGLAIRPDYIEALRNRGAALCNLERFEEALASYDRALAIRSDYVEAFHYRGNALQQLKRFDEALQAYDRALAIRPDYVETLYDRGVALRNLERLDEALASYNRALLIRPNYTDALKGRGNVLRGLKRFEDALASYQQAFAIKPDDPYALAGLADSALQICDWACSAKLADEVVTQIIERQASISPFTLLATCDDPALHLRCAKNFIRRTVRLARQPLWEGTVWRHQRIRIAYLSGDFHAHAIPHLMTGLIERHDRSRFEVVGVSFGPDDGSEMRSRVIKAFDQFHDVRARSDLEAAKLLQALEIDIAVDLKGYTKDARLGILAYRPAPIQASYLGYPGTIGGEFIDYVIADPTVLPFDQQPFYSEKIVHLPECYQVNDSKRKIAERIPTRREAGLPDEGFVFCCFNNNYKITAPVFDVWMGLLEAAENSVLWLLRDNEAAERNLRSEATARGIDPIRLVFADRIPPEQHLARHRLADLFLDTLPYNAHTTASDALWTGVPVLTCRGMAFAGRVGASLLAGVGLPELVTDSLEAYQALGERLATDRSLLRRLREKLIHNRLNHPLFDTDRFCRHIEAAYTTMWELWQRGAGPQSFTVEPHRGTGDEYSQCPEADASTLSHASSVRPPGRADDPRESRDQQSPVVTRPFIDLQDKLGDQGRELASPQRAPTESRAASEETADPRRLLDGAVALHQKGRVAEAERLYMRILEAQPDHFDAMHLLGVIRHQEDRDAEALDLIASALKGNPRSADALSNFGVVLNRLGRHEDAISSCDLALAIRPEDAEALYTRGIALKRMGRIEEAVASYERALAIRPEDAVAISTHGNVLKELGRLDDALASYERALAIRPDFPELLNNRGIVLSELKRFEEALASYDRALAIRPDYAEVLNNRNAALSDMKRFEEALASYEQLRAVNPDYRYALGGLAHSALQICDWTRSAKHVAEIAAQIEQAQSVIHPFTLLGHCDDPALQLRCATSFIRDRIRTSPRPLWSGTLRHHDRMRIAYLSADFHEHATAFLTAELFERHDRSRFEVVGISFGRDDASGMRTRLVRAFDQFHDVRTKSDLEAAKLLRALEIDIAVDLKGYTRDCRPAILAHRPAPIQVSYLGYPGTLGAEFIDYVIADAIVLPSNQQPFYTEKIVQLPGCYQVNDSKRRIGERTPTRREAGLPAEGFVFCCFNNNYKITAPVFDIWMRLLGTVENSVLWLVRDNAGAESNLRKEAAARAIDPVRLVFADRLPVEEHLARHRLADLFLDTLPVNAHTTASDALWAGLPVLTCRGQAFAGRVAASLLTAVGLPELVTDSLEVYEALGLRLAADAPLLDGLREKLAKNRLTHPLFDTDRSRRHIEAAYTTMWEHWQRGESPRGFTVAPYQGVGDQGGRRLIADPTERSHLSLLPSPSRRSGSSESQDWRRLGLAVTGQFVEPCDEPGIQEHELAPANHALVRPVPAKYAEAELAALLDQAIAFHQGGELGEAQRLYIQILGAQPDHFDAMHLLGVVRQQQGRNVEALELIASALKKKPHSAEALSNLGVALYRLGRREEAISICDRALAIRPDYAQAFYNRGIVLNDLGRFDEAVASYDKAIALDPTNADALTNRGNTLKRLGRIKEAAASYERALALRPDDPLALSAHGDLLKELGQLDDALESYERALAIRPDLPEVLNNRGIVLATLKRFEEALASYDRALAIRSDHADALNNRGVTLWKLQRFEEALASYDRALAIRSDHADALNNRGVTLWELQRFEEAVASCDRALALWPDFAQAFSNRGNALLGLKRFEEALASYDKAIELKSDYVDALTNRGTALVELQRLDEALASYDTALAHKTDHVEALNNRGTLLAQLRRLDEALASYDRAVQVDPNNGEHKFNRSLLLLTRGQFDTGWREYESRRSTKLWVHRSFAVREWAGEEVAGKRVLLYGEQGLGDVIQFARFARSVALLGAKVILGVPAPLGGLLQRLDGEVSIVRKGENLPDFDLHLPLLSVPFILGLTPERTAAEIPYLSADPVRVDLWSSRLPADAFKVGVAWQGNPAAVIDKGRSVPLNAFAPLSQVPGVRLISLQKGAGVEQLADLPPGMTVDTLGPDFDAGPDAFLDTAAVMMNLDLIVTCDTAVAHLAGALGRPVWIALKPVPDWRWMLDREDSPWYPTARLFRQSRAGDWDAVFTRIAAELAQLTAKRQPHPIRQQPPVPLLDQAITLHQGGRLAEAERLYSRILEVQPDHADAMHLLGVIRHQQGRHAEALDLIESALIRIPRSAAALSNLGAVLHHLERHPEALAAYDRALAIRPNDAQAHYNRGIALDKLGRPDDAVEGYDQAIALDSDYTDALINRGNTLKGLGRLEEAVASYDRALALRPDDAAALTTRGNLLKELGRLDEALASYERALALRPELAGVLNNRGLVLSALKRSDEALVSFDEAIALEPDYVDAFINRGNVLQSARRLDEAVASYDRALEIRPDYAEALNNRGNALLALKRFDEALENYEQALEIRPDYAEALNNRGIVLTQRGRLEDALSSYQRALAIRPNYADALNNRGNALRELNRFDEALASYERAIQIDPNNAEHRLNRSLLLLTLGHFEDGRREYESRRTAKVWEYRNFEMPEWTTRGEAAGKRVLLYGEQGLGDVIQFARFVRSVALLGAKVILEVPAPLGGLLQRLDGEVSIVRKGENLPDFDLHLPLLSVPFILGLTPERTAAEIPYLSADPVRVDLWSSRLAADAFKVGVAWQGNPAAVIDKGRSVPLKAFAPLSQVPGVRLISLQKGAGIEQLADLPPGMTVETLGPDFDEGPDAFLDTAAVMMNLDLIMTSDTAVAHLAGALGRPVWIILKHVPDWRWMMDREDSPWYPTARLFRQSRAGDWDAVFTRIAAELAQLAAKSQPHPIQQQSPARRREPDIAEALNNRGNVLWELKRFEEALATYERALALRPNYPDALTNRGAVLSDLKHFEEALASYDKALALRPAFAEALNNRGIALKELRRLDEALVSYDKALAIKPDYPEALNNRGNVLQELKRFEEAVASFNRALAARPDYAEALYNRGNVLGELNRLEEAVASYDKALAIRPDYRDAFNNRGNALKELKRLDEALASYDRAVKLDPGHGEHRFNRSLLLLLVGSSGDRWREYEWRRKSKTWVGRGFKGPEWVGENVSGRRILLYSEQALGDTIQFARFARIVAMSGADVMLEVQAPLGGLLQRLHGPAIVVRNGDQLPDFDLHLPLMSVPFVIGLTAERIPAEVPYLSADPVRVDRWSSRWPASEFRVGIAWQGNHMAPADKGRSIPLRAFEPLSRIAGAKLISLQKGAGVGQLGDLPQGMTVETLGPDFDEGPDAFLDTAAVMMNVDLIVTSDTAVAHLAGALGRPVWIILKHVPDWRWMLDREDSPWYPTARLFRQSRAGDWDAVFSRIAAELGHFAAKSQSCRIQQQPPARPLDQAIALQHAGNHRELEIRHDDARRFYDRATALLALKRLDEALVSYDAAIALEPDDAEALHNRGVVLKELNRLDEALASYDRALAIRPDYAEALNNRGVALCELRRLEEALASYDRALGLRPDYAEALSNRGAALCELRHFEEALASYEKALTLEPNSAEALNNRGIVLKELNRLDEALASYDAALAINPDYPEALNNRGNVLRELKQFDQALDSWDQAVKLKPGYPDAEFNKSLCQLLLGDFSHGWKGYEQRWLRSAAPVCRHAAHRLWLGAEEASGHTILLHAEQGLGDTIQFVRYAPLVQQRGGRVVLEVQTPLKTLLRTLPSSESKVFAYGEALPEFDLQCPLLSLPLAFDTTEPTIPWTGAYLRADEERLHRWWERLGESALPRVGVVWSGNAANFKLRHRSIALETLGELFALPLEWLCLQKQIDADDRVLLESCGRLRQFADEIGDFADTAALIACCNMVISVDTAVAHLAGAMGKPVWILLPYVPAWRWLLNREDSPWYPTARLFRQQRLGDWSGVIRLVHGELQESISRLQPIGSGQLEFSSSSPPTSSRAARGQRLSPPAGNDQRNTLGRTNRTPTKQASAQRQPADPSRMIEQAVALQREGRLAEAEQFYESIMQAQPNHFDAMHLLGVIRHQQGRDVEALDLITAALKINPWSTDALSNHGQVLHRLARDQEAVASYDRGLAIRPDDAHALYNRGTALLALKRPDEALISYDKAIALDPDYTEALHNRGVALKELNRLDEALASYDQALALRPDYAEALSNRGIALCELKRFEEALASYDRALALRPDYTEALGNRGAALCELGHFGEALAGYEKALTLEPNSAQVLNNRGIVLRTLERLDEALASYDKALAIKPDYPEALNNRGNVLTELERIDEALASYDKALAIKPDYPEALSNRGNTLRELQRFVEAQASYDRAISLEPNYADAAFNKALCQLLQGDFCRGWLGYEQRRLRKRPVAHRHAAHPLWLGAEELSGRAILLHSEQGFGDAIQFVRYALEVQRFGARVLLEVQAPLKALMGALPFGVEVFAVDEALPEFDFQCPLLSLPLTFKTTEATIPWAGAYLSGEEDRLRGWHERLGDTALPRVGIVWSGNAANYKLRRRSIALGTIGELFALPVEWICLQKEINAGDRAVLSRFDRLREFADEIGDFADTAALIACCDLVISVDTAVAHLAGAMGKPVWILLPYAADWRWLLDRQDSPWYPTARLFRQPRAGDWADVIRRVRMELEELSAASLIRRGPGEVPVLVPQGENLLRSQGPEPPRGNSDPSQLLDQAISHHQNGRLTEAESLYLDILAAQPDHFDAEHLLGVVRHQQGRDLEALELIGSALKRRPRSAEALSNQGAVLQRLGRHEEALASYYRALMIRPDDVQALYNRGIALTELGRPDEALASYERALAIQPDRADAIKNRDLVLRELEQRKAVSASGGKVVRECPIDNQVIFEWQISSYFAWGLFGLNLLLSWWRLQGPSLLTSVEFDESRLALNVFEKVRLRPALEQSRALQAWLRSLGRDRFDAPVPVLHCLGNGIRGLEPPVKLVGNPNVGVIVCETTEFSSEAQQRAKAYQLLIAGSTWNREILEQAGLRPTVVVLQGIDPSHFHPGPKLGFFADRFTVFTGGKLEYRKAQDLVLLAFRVFAERHPEALLVTLWSSPWPEYARSLEANPAIRPVCFRPDGGIDATAWAVANGVRPEQILDLGVVPNADLARLYREMDVALFPNRCEGGTNQVAMECMACGVPVILSSNTGHLDLIAAEWCIPLKRQAALAGADRLGWCESDVEEMIEALERVWRDRAAARALGSRGAEFMTRLTWDETARRIAEAISAVPTPTPS